MKSFALIICLWMLSGNSILAQTYYYSNNSSSDFNDPLGWGTNTDGSGNNPAVLNNTCILVLSHHKTNSGIATIRGLQIKNGGSFTSNFSVFLDGTGKFFKIDSGGIYIQDHIGTLGSSLFSGTETFESGSIVEFRQWPSVIPGASWGYLKFNNSNNNNNCQLSGNTSQIKNDLIINNGNGSINLSANSNFNASLEGNLEIQNGCLDLANNIGTNSMREFHIWGKIKIKNGILKCTGSSNPVSFYFEGGQDSIIIENGNWNTSNFKIYLQQNKKLILNGNLTLATGAILELLGNNSNLQILPGKIITNLGLIQTNTGLMEFQSDTSGTAMIGESSGSFSGPMTFYQTIPAGLKRYRFLSSPITNGNFTQLIDDIFITGPGGKLYGFDSTQSNNSSAFYYDETVSLPNANYGWEPLLQINTPMNSGQGFRVLIRGDRSNNQVLYQNIANQNEVKLDFNGIPNSGNIDISSICNYTSSGDASSDGWNLMGNPYPCNLDWNKIYDQNDFSNVNPSIYQRDAKSGNYVAWNAATNTGTGSPIIAPFGGFLIQFNQSPIGNFKESHKTTQTQPRYFKNTSAQILLEVKEQYGSDLLLIGEGAQFNKNYSVMEDILKLFAGPTLIASRSFDNQWLCNDNRNFRSEQFDTIQLILGGNGKVLVNVSDLSENIDVVLFNDSTLQKFELKKGVQFNLTPGQLDSVHWKLLIKQKVASGEDEYHVSGLEVYPNPFDNKIHIRSERQGIKEIEIMDLEGKSVFHQQFEMNPTQIEIFTNNLGNQFYVLKMKDQDEGIQFKKLIKQ